MKLNIKLAYGLDASKESPQRTSLNVLEMFVNSAHKDGVDGHYRRMWGRIQRKFEEAVEKNQESVELDGSEVDLLKNAIREGKIPTIYAKFSVILEDEIEKLTNEEKK